MPAQSPQHICKVYIKITGYTSTTLRTHNTSVTTYPVEWRSRAGLDAAASA